MMKQPVTIETEGIQKIFGMNSISVRALDDVSIKIRNGEFVAIMGPSGSGKSTLMNILGCLSQPTSGRYLLDGEDVSGLSKNELAAIRNQKIGFIFQSYNLLPRTSALSNVLLPLLYDRNQHLSQEAQMQTALDVLEAVGLSDRIDHQPHELSGGQQQRVAIARALVNDPSLILADEPTGNLDSQSGLEIMNLLLELHRQGRTIVMVTHDHGIAAVTERSIHIRDGKIESIVQNDGAHKQEGGGR